MATSAMLHRMTYQGLEEGLVLPTQPPPDGGLCRSMIYLVFDAWFVEVVSADGTGVGADIPGPHRHGIPFLDLKTWRWRE